MSPDRDSGRLGDDDLDVDERDAAPRSIFSALWFRVLLAVLILGVVAAIAVPFVLDTQTLRISVAKSAPVPPGPAAPVTGAPAAPAVTPPAPETPAPPPATAAPATPPPSAVTARPKLDAASAPVAKPATAKSATTVAKASESARSAPRAEKPAPTAAEVTPRAAGAAPKAEATPKAPEVAKASAAEAAKPSPAKAAGGGKAYWVQVGAFKDAETAKRIAARLREQGLRVEESPITPAAAAAAPRAATPPPGADRYDVLVSGASAADVEARLAPKGFRGESTANGVVVRPSLALREAVALSRDLADAGLSVQVRRIGGATPAPAPAPPPAAPTGGPTLYRVRVGGFAERAAAVDAMKQLEGKGFKPFIARGNE